MLLAENAFYILGASMSDDRSSLMSLASKNNMQYTTEQRASAMQMLTSYKRIRFELRWFPGCTDIKVGELLYSLKLIQKDHSISLPEIVSLPALARLNYLQEALKYLYTSSMDRYAEYAIAIIETYQQLNPKEIMQQIDDSRIRGNWPLIESIDVIESELITIKMEVEKCLQEKLLCLSQDQQINFFTALDQYISKKHPNDKHLFMFLIDYYVKTIVGKLKYIRDEVATTVQMQKLILANKLQLLENSSQVIKGMDNIQALAKKLDDCTHPIQKYIDNESPAIITINQVITLSRTLMSDMLNSYANQVPTSSDINEFSVYFKLLKAITDYSLKTLGTFASIFNSIPTVFNQLQTDQMILVKKREELTSLERETLMKSQQRIQKKEKQKQENKKRSAALITVLVSFIVIIYILSSSQRSIIVASSPTKPSPTITKATVIPTSTPTVAVALPIPKNGYFFSYTAEELVAPLSVKVPQGKNYYYITLATTSSKKKILSFIVHPGKTVEVLVPLGQYKLYYTMGKDWYGKDVLFGSMASYFVAEATLKFYSHESATDITYYGHTIELIKQVDGNLETVAIPLADFPK